MNIVKTVTKREKMSKNDDNVVSLRKKAHETLKKHIKRAESIASDAQGQLEAFQMGQLLKRKAELLKRIEVLDNKQSKSESDMISLLNISNQLNEIDRNIEDFDDFHVGFEPDDDTIEFETSPEQLAHEDEEKTKLENEVLAQHASLLERLDGDEPKS